MSGSIKITRAGPLVTVQDTGRQGHFADGISASGPMDISAFVSAGEFLGTKATSGLEITTAGIAFMLAGKGISAAFAGGDFALAINGKPRNWNAAYKLKSGDEVDIKPGPAGNYGYVRFNADLDVPLVLNSRATNLIVGVGGHEGRALKPGDTLELLPVEKASEPTTTRTSGPADGPIRFIWGIHADNFAPEVRALFISVPFSISIKLDRMGVRLGDPDEIFSSAQILSLVSDPIVPGDIQILGDGTPIVLMRDHQPTGGYPRIATVISADLDRFAQLRPGAKVQFEPVTVEHAQAIARASRRRT